MGAEREVGERFFPRFVFSRGCWFAGLFSLFCFAVFLLAFCFSRFCLIVLFLFAGLFSRGVFRVCFVRGTRFDEEISNKSNAYEIILAAIWRFLTDS